MIEPLAKPAPVRGSAIQGAVMGCIHENTLPLFVHESVLEEILEYSEQDVSSELGGFLLGGYHEDQQPYVEIRHFLPAAGARSRAASLTFTHETWSRLNHEVENQYPEELVVGWHHTHPDFGIFLSAYDLFIHRHFFREPWQVAMVVDPKRQEFGFFQWQDDQVTDCGFVCVKES
jgi:proteasome lid subunit RPN8/RPN11